MPQPISRTPLIRSKDHYLDLELPEGDWIVWWYSAYYYDPSTKAPLINVLFRKLEDGFPTTFRFQKIPVSLLGLYQPGYILEGNTVSARAETAVEEFEVDYRDWIFDSRRYAEKNKSPMPFSDADYALPAECQDDWLMEIPTSKGNLLINCTEFLVRGYSRRSEIPRILTGYEWHDVEERLFSIINKNYSSWIIYPHAQIVNEDTYLLAHIQCDIYTREACRSIFSNLHTDNYKSGNPEHPHIKPWFLGKGKVKCRGYRVNDRKDFLCTELIGMSLPEGKPFETIRFKKEKNDDALYDALNLQDLHHPEKTTLERLPLTDKNEPRRGGQREEIEHGEFQVLYPARHVRRTKEITDYAKHKHVINDSPAAEQFTTNEHHGNGDFLTGRVFISTMDIPENVGGTLLNMWNAFQHLKKLGHINSVDWFVPDNVFGNKLPLTCVEIDGKRLPWAELGNGRQRGMLMLRIRAQNKTFLVVELERDLNPTSKNGDIYTEDKISGMICSVRSLGEACNLARILSDNIAHYKGNFKKLRALRGLPDFKTFHHKSSRANTVPLESTAINALLIAGLDIKKLRTNKNSKKTEQ